VRISRGEIFNAGHSGSIQHLTITHKGGTHDQVLLEGAVEQLRVLRYVTDVAPQIGWVNLQNIDPIDEHGPGCRLIKAENQLFQRGFSRTDASKYAHALTGTYVQVDAA